MRWVVLGASVLLQTCLGALYAWSTFVPALKSGYGLSGGQAGFVFGLAIAVFTAAMIYAGRLVEVHGPRPVAMTGAVLFGAGYLLASASGGLFPLLLISLGVLAGAGTGFGYVCPLATCVRWFPRHKGLVTGVAVAGFGGGATLLSGIAGRLLAQGVPVLEIFRWIGLVYGMATLAGAMALRFPEPIRREAQRLMPLRSLLRNRNLLSLAAGMFAGTFGGLLVIGNLGPIGLAARLPADDVIRSIQVFALGNAAGRIGWGWLYDRTGWVILPISLLALLGSIAALAVADSPGAFVWLAASSGFCFGACFVLYAAEVAARFGHERVGSVYPLVFLAYGFSGLTGPPMGGWIHDWTDSFLPAFAIAAAVLVLGMAAVGWGLRRASGPGAPGALADR